MRIESHRNFEKRWAKLTKPQQTRAAAAIRLFVDDPSASQLRLHQLKGEGYPQYSISAGGDLRIHFAKVEDNHIVLMAIGSHSQLYR